jgi:hypothetical protein
MSTPNEKFADQRFKHPSPGIGAVGQYQTSGIPFLSSSFIVPDILEGPGNFLEMDFPYVTKFVTVINEHSGSSVKMRVGFSALGITGSGAPSQNGDNYFVLDNGESYTGEFRVSSLFIAGVEGICTASVIAGMTGIPAGKLRTNWSGTSGVG